MSTPIKFPFREAEAPTPDNPRPRTPRAREVPGAFDLLDPTTSSPIGMSTPIKFNESSYNESSIVNETSFLNDSFVSSVYADQLMYTTQIKSEPVTNLALIEFVETLCLLRPRN